MIKVPTKIRCHIELSVTLARVPKCFMIMKGNVAPTVQTITANGARARLLGATHLPTDCSKPTAGQGRLISIETASECCGLIKDTPDLSKQIYSIHTIGTCTLASNWHLFILSSFKNTFLKSCENIGSAKQFPFKGHGNEGLRHKN